MEIQFNIFSDARLQISFLSGYEVAIYQLPQAPFTEGAAPAQWLPTAVPSILPTLSQPQLTSDFPSLF